MGMSERNEPIVDTSTKRSTPAGTPTATSPETERTSNLPSPRDSTRTLPETLATLAPWWSSPRRTLPEVACTSTVSSAAPISTSPEVGRAIDPTRHPRAAQVARRRAHAELPDDRPDDDVAARRGRPQPAVDVVGRHVATGRLEVRRADGAGHLDVGRRRGHGDVAALRQLDVHRDRLAPQQARAVLARDLHHAPSGCRPSGRHSMVVRSTSSSAPGVSALTETVVAHGRHGGTVTSPDSFSTTSRTGLGVSKVRSMCFLLSGRSVAADAGAPTAPAAGVGTCCARGRGRCRR